MADPTRDQDYFRELHRVDDIRLWARAALLQIDRIEAAHASDDEESEVPQKFIEIHLLFVVADHLFKAIERRPKGRGVAPLDQSTTRSIQELRNVFEHWETSRARIERAPDAELAELRKQSPDAWPWTLSEAGDGSLILSNAVNLKDLRRKLNLVVDQALQLRRELEAELL